MPTTAEAPPYYCLICKVTYGPLPANLGIHLRGKNHQRNIRKNPSNLVQPTSTPTPTPLTTEAVNCPACNIAVGGGEDGWRGHIKGAKHKTRASKIPNYVELQYTSLQQVDPSNLASRKRSNYTCIPCDRILPLSVWAAHMNSGKHKKRVIRTSKSVSLAQTLPDAQYPNTRLCVECRAIFHVSDWSVHLQTVTHHGNAAVIEPQPEPSPPNIRPPVQSTSPKVKTTVKPPPKVQNPPQITSPNDNGQEPRTGGRVRKVWRRRGRGVLIPGVAAPHLEVIPWIKKLGSYRIPENIESIFSSEVPHFKRELDEVRKKVPITLSSATYEQSWRTLLFAEEIQMRDDLSRYDMHDVPLVRHGLYYQLVVLSFPPQRLIAAHLPCVFPSTTFCGVFSLEVPGLAEKRPSVLVGDTFTVKAKGTSDNGPSYEGHVHYVYQKEVGLRFDKRFQAKTGQLFDVEFQLNRMTLRRMHHNLVMPMSKEDRRRILFPQTNHFDSVPRIIESHTQDLKHRIVNPLILNNPRQLLAVGAIRERPAGSPPLIIWGPPGTGKTITAVEGIRQILLKDPQARILACAPSNSAADLIAQRLLDLGKDVLFRLNAPSRPKSLLPPELLPFTSVIKLDSKYPSDSAFYRNAQDGHEVFSCPPVETVVQFKVIVSTCGQSGVPYGIGIPRGHFTHIFIDEAGQALEPDIMIPIRTMLVNNTNLILCGDPKQLGPIVHSPITRQLGFGTSYLERLVNLPAYDHNSTGPGVAIVRLTQNFRSHPSILKFPSDQFYDGEVLPYGRPDIINSLVDWEDLPKKGFPIIFHAIKGENLQEATSPSYFNPQEASTVKEYIDKLRSLGLSHSDVGIIAPYRAQCQKIRKLVHSNDRLEAKYKVGSVEEFQGQERKVTIVSTVRSDQNLAANFDKKHSLGFIAQERRFNVAVTRAQALLIVIGDPGVLGRDPVWWAFMNYVYSNGGWCGSPIEWDPQGEFDPDGPRGGDDSGLPDEDLDYPPPADVTWAQYIE